MRFPALRIAREVLEAGGSAGTVLNAANEVAVEAFLARRIGFLAIAAAGRGDARCKPASHRPSTDSVEDVLAIDYEVRATANAPARPVCIGRVGRTKKRQNSKVTPLMETIVKLSGFGDTLLGYLLPFLFVLTIVVFVHELGHFLVARWCGVGIKAFSIGFGPEIVGFNDRYGTRWKISWIPLGGYVKFIDDENAASAGAAGGRSINSRQKSAREASRASRSLNARPSWRRDRSPISSSPSSFSLRSSASSASASPPPRWTSSIPAARPRGPASSPGDRVISIDGTAIETLRRDAAHRRHEPRQAIALRGRPWRQDRRHHRDARAQGPSPTDSATPCAWACSASSGTRRPRSGL